MRFLRHVYFQVLIGIAAGILLGIFAPAVAIETRPFADGFVKIIKMCIGPIVFLAIVHGINSAGDLKTAGRVGLKAFVYFEVVTTIAMLVSWSVGEVLQPGAGLHVRMADLDPAAIASLAGPAATGHATGGAAWLKFIPGSLFEPFVKNDVVQLLVLGILGGIALLGLNKRVPVLASGLDQATQWMFALMRMLTRLAPLAAFGAIGFTVGKFGLRSLLPLMKLVGAYYVGVALFLFLILWGVLAWCGAGLVPFLRYIKDEIAIVFGTIASEAVMPRLIVKLEHLGCRKDVVRIVLPTAYSFNLDGTALYLVLAPLFIAQALDLHVPLSQKLELFLLLLVMSKGAAGVTAGVLVTLVSTMSAHPVIPAAGLAITLGVDRFLNEGRAVINLIGNAVAGVAIARWEGVLDRDRMNSVLRGEVPLPSLDAPVSPLAEPTPEPVAVPNGAIATQ